MHITEQKIYYTGHNLIVCAVPLSLASDALLCSFPRILPTSTAFS